MTDPRFILSVLILSAYVWMAFYHAPDQILTALRDALMMAVTFYFHAISTEQAPPRTPPTAP